MRLASPVYQFWDRRINAMHGISEFPTGGAHAVHRRAPRVVLAHRRRRASLLRRRPGADRVLDSCGELRVSVAECLRNEC